MGLLDRFKKESAASPDALTREAVARVRAVPGVDGVDVVDGDTLQVSWRGLDAPATVSLADIRQPWSAARGFDRIEVMDDFIAALGPPAPGDTTVTDPTTPASTTPDHAVPEPAGDELHHTSPVAESESVAGAEAGSDAAWDAARAQLRPVVGRPGPPDADTVHWPVADVLEATVVLDGPVALPVGPAELAQWGVDADAVRAAALANQASVDPGLDPIAPDEPAWVPTRPAGQPTSWLCAPDRLLDASGLTEAVVLAPLASELVVVDAAAVPVLESILTSTLQIIEHEARTLWPAPFLVRPGSIEPWTPPADHPCARLVEHMRQLGG